MSDILSNKMFLYPFLFNPILQSVVWGGHKLTNYKGLELNNKPIGESWEVSTVPNKTSIIDNGKYKGIDLTSIIKTFPIEILGKAVSERYNGQMPLLAKFIDAQQDLSIQVHPNDEMAQREHGKKGKSEMWYIIDAKPGSYLYAGFNKEITQEEYKERITNNTITEVLAKHEVNTGDVFYLPAGRIHAIGAGILLAEVQQSSDVTYRIYDYNRKGLDGKPRELHTELAAQALDYHVEPEYRTLYDGKINKANLIIDSPYFSVRVTENTKSFHRNMLKYDSFVISMCIEGDCEIKIRDTGNSITLRHGYTCLIPAAIADYDIIPANGRTKILEAFIDNKERSLTKKITRFLHLSGH